MELLASTSSLAYARGFSALSSHLLPQNSAKCKSYKLIPNRGKRRTTLRIRSVHSSSQEASTRLEAREAVASSTLASSSATNGTGEIRTEGRKSHVSHFYRRPFLSVDASQTLLRALQDKVSPEIEAIATEQCFNIQINGTLNDEEWEILRWILRETYEPKCLSPVSLLLSDTQNSENDKNSTEADPTILSSPAAVILEVGPRLSFSTAFSSNAVSICKAAGLAGVSRLERSRRYRLTLSPGAEPLTATQVEKFASIVHDRMTECVYEETLQTFDSNVKPAPVEWVPVMERGRAALEEINDRMGLAFDEFDLDYYCQLFKDVIGRDPSNVELFDIAQSNSEHSRHWFFKGVISVDGEQMPESLMDLVKETLEANKNNSVIGFKDNSSAIRGGTVRPILPVTPGEPSPMEPTPRDLDILFTAETHNFPCAVAPFPGAETGAGGRIRDTMATGIGSLVVAATAGYCVGNLQLEGHYAPWEDSSFAYPPNLAPPLQILIDASDGASDYGNKFGEPLIQGYTRTFGSRLPNGERREWLKPIMFSAGIGQIDHSHLYKSDPEFGMLVVKIGGPAYRIGMGGGAASSMVSGSRDALLDFDAVQRGDAEMAQKVYRAVWTCVEMGEKNPIVSIHDQGAGGNCNVVKEIIYPPGAKIDVRAIQLGDETMSVLEIWGAEFQEQVAILIRPESESMLRSICSREKVPMAVIGTISGDGRVVLYDSREEEEARAKGQPPPPPAVDLDLEKVLGDMPRKHYSFHRASSSTWSEPIDLPPHLTLMEALKRVLRLPSVCSKRFLTTKVDRCVTGLVAQQQTVGPLQLPLADVAVISQTHTGITGAACAIGEQPMKGLLDPKAMARMAVGEALTNLVWAKVTSLSDVKASGNWMYAAKLGGEGAHMFDAAVAMRDAMKELEIAIDGGKDSLSMAAKAGDEVVMAPGNLVISAYVTCPDITLTVTPDIKLPGESVLVHLDLGKGERRLGGSAFAHAFDQVGNQCPDVDVSLLKRSFNTVQQLLTDRLISAGHDISDGGLLTAVLEMAFAADCGLDLDIKWEGGNVEKEGEGEREGEFPFNALFAEELGMVIEVSLLNLEALLQVLSNAEIPHSVLGTTRPIRDVHVAVNGDSLLSASTSLLRDMWEDTSFALEKMQRVERCTESERAAVKAGRKVLSNWTLSFDPQSPLKPTPVGSERRVKVAVLREEGSNGYREMAAMVSAAGMEAWDVTMTDLLEGRANLKSFQGIIFVGGFSYADVLDSAKGWAATIRFNPSLLSQFQAFYNRDESFSLGICNGCQLMALLGWVPGNEIGGSLGEGGDLVQPRFVHNASGKFECRFSTVEISDSPSIFLKEMAGTRVGIWVAHGEGRALFPSEEIFSQVIGQNLAPIRYVDDNGKATEEYPFNPNGSPLGIAGMCSPNGRHLAMMPHPERCFLMWQMPWLPSDWSQRFDTSGHSPWLRMLENAREWALQRS